MMHMNTCKYVLPETPSHVQGIEGLVETSPGVRSCMIEYDQRRLPLHQLLDILLKTEQQLPEVPI